MIAAIGGGRLSFIGLVLIGLVGVALAAMIAWPLVRPPAHVAEEIADDHARRATADDLDRALATIRALDVEHASGDLSDDDYAGLVTAERARAVDLMRRLGKSPEPPHGGEPSET